MKKIGSWLESKLVDLFERACMRLFMTRRPFDIERVAYWQASVDSAKFFQQSMKMATNYVTRPPLLEAAIQEVATEGLWLEFGVASGVSTKMIAERTKNKVYGFDSFDGLPEDWTHFQKKGRYTTQGHLPVGMPDNVEFVKGWFDESLPTFIEQHPEPIAFLHVDSDLYSSASLVLTLLRHQIQPGTIIQFDEFFNYPGWQDHEFRAFNEFVAMNRVKFEYLGFASSEHQVAVKILEIHAKSEQRDHRSNAA